MNRLRKTRVERTTKETAVRVELNIDGKGKTSVETTIPFLDHLVSTIAKHSMMDLKIVAKSKDKIVHHIAEDVAITLANAMDKALGNREKIFRFGHAIVPMDDALAFHSLLPCLILSCSPLCSLLQDQNFQRQVKLGHQNFPSFQVSLLSPLLHLDVQVQPLD